MAAGKTNANMREAVLASNELICVFRCTYSSTTRANVWRFVANDYVSYNSDTYTFTAKRPFSAKFLLFGRGACNQNGSNKTISYTFYKGGSSLYTGTFGYGGGIASQVTLSFTKNETFKLDGEMSSADLGVLGFAMQL